MPGKVVCRDEWLAARKDLLDKEKAAVRAAAAFNEQLRNDFPMVKLDKAYTFEDPKGNHTLAGLFQGRKQLIVYHFMLGPDDEAGCSGCSFLTDNLPSSLTHLYAADTTFVLVSRAPVAKIEQYKKRMGWDFPWYSSFGTEFNWDFNVSLDKDVKSPVVYNCMLTQRHKEMEKPFKGEHPGLSVFYKEGNDLFHTYSTYARGLDGLLVTNQLLDLTPLGRQDVPWKRHDEYDSKDLKSS
ncbi:hypothetical protein F5882DRAFT_459799 [Hyaloscypha sp. PMI_1271]|nr:hypothetical protein F5882DRAFT_459799 [Hyaloscypha sp. PMI_1271]